MTRLLGKGARFGDGGLSMCVDDLTLWFGYGDDGHAAGYLEQS